MYVDTNKHEAFNVERVDQEQWLRIEYHDIPTGIVEVDVRIEDGSGKKHDAIMFAGHIATEVSNDNTTVHPMLGWVLAHKHKKYKGSESLDEIK